MNAGIELENGFRDFSFGVMQNIGRIKSNQEIKSDFVGKIPL